jgi:hypothetical protein
MLVPAPTRGSGHFDRRDGSPETNRPIHERPVRDGIGSQTRSRSICEYDGPRVGDETRRTMLRTRGGPDGHRCPEARATAASRARVAPAAPPSSSAFGTALGAQPGGRSLAQRASARSGGCALARCGGRIASKRLAARRTALGSTQGPPEARRFVARSPAQHGLDRWGAPAEGRGNRPIKTAP